MIKKTMTDGSVCFIFQEGDIISATGIKVVSMEMPTLNWAFGRVCFLISDVNGLLKKRKDKLAFGVIDFRKCLFSGDVETYVTGSLKERRKTVLKAAAIQLTELITNQCSA